MTAPRGRVSRLAKLWRQPAGPWGCNERGRDMTQVVVQDDYKVQLDVFEGPLDLLLYLIKKDEVDIYNIPIERVTKQYMEYLSLMKLLDLNIAGEFIVMAATLMMIKSRILLPVDERPDLEDEEDDPRWELVKQLVEYKKFKEAAAHLQQREYFQENIFTRGSDSGLVVEPDAGVGLGDVSLFDLISAFNEALKKIKVDDFGEIYDEKFTVVDKIEFVLGTVRDKGKATFSSLFEKAASRNEIVCTFLAILELIRLRQLVAQQDGDFGEIVIAQEFAEQGN
jgi:segregation and condensation protein A